MLNIKKIDTFYSGVTADGKMVVTPEFRAAIQRCYRSNGIDAGGRANDAAGVFRCACDATDDATLDRYTELQKMVDAKRGQCAGAGREQTDKSSVGDFEEEAEKSREYGRRALGGERFRDVFRRDRGLHHATDSEVDDLIAVERMYASARGQRRAN